MADISSGLPIRSQLPGQANYDDIIAKIGDGTTPSQLLAVDTAGLIGSKLYDGTGTAVTSQANGAQQALDVGINVGGVQIDPRSIRALTAADVVTANQGTANTNANAWFTRLTDGTNDSVLLATGELTVSVTQPLPTGTNTIGAVNQGTSPWITKDQSDGPVAPGAVAAFSQLTGGQYNSALPTLTNTQQSAIQLDSSGRQIISPLTNSSAVKAQLQDDNGTAITLGQKVMASSIPVVISSDQSPIPVSFSVDNNGTEVNSYNTASAVAGGATSNHDYTVTALKTLLLTQIVATSSGKAKIEVQVETGVASGVFNTRFVQFNSTANPNMIIELKSVISVAAGVRVRVIRTNKEILAQDVYSTISGQEV